MSVLCLNVCKICVPNIKYMFIMYYSILGICVKKLHLVKVGAFA